MKKIIFIISIFIYTLALCSTNNPFLEKKCLDKINISNHTPNVFIPIVSFFWSDRENWSKGHVPYLGEDVELSPDSVVQLYNPGCTTVVGKLNITEGSVLTIFSELTSINTTSIVGTLIMFKTINISEISLNNGLIWILNNASIYSEKNIILGINDTIIVGTLTTSNIYATIINKGKLLILEDTKLYIRKYLQTISGALYIHYNSTVTNIGFLYGQSLTIYGKIFIDCEMQINIKHNICVPIVQSINSLHVSTPITDTCGYMTNYSVTNNTILACFRQTKQ